MIIRFKQVQSATASWASALSLPLPSTVHPSASLCCCGYSRTWCGFWLVRLCSKDGPVIPPSLPPLCLCHIQLHPSPNIQSYANVNSSSISPHTQVLCPYGPSLNLKCLGLWHLGMFLTVNVLVGRKRGRREIRACHWLSKRKTLLVKDGMIRICVW